MLLTARKPTDQSDRHILLPEAIRSIRTVLDRDGQVVRDQDHDPFGNEITALTTGSYFHRFQFAGGITDSTTRVYHFGQHSYDLQIGRWTRYAGSDPVNRTDRSGLWSLTFEVPTGQVWKAVQALLLSRQGIQMPPRWSPSRRQTDSINNQR